MKEKTKAKLQQSLQDLIAELSQLQQEIEPLKQEICNLPGSKSLVSRRKFRTLLTVKVRNVE